jgi:hypothetical protein
MNKEIGTTNVMMNDATDLKTDHVRELNMMIKPRYHEEEIEYR